MQLAVAFGLGLFFGFGLQARKQSLRAGIGTGLYRHFG